MHIISWKQYCSQDFHAILGGNYLTCLVFKNYQNHQHFLPTKKRPPHLPWTFDTPPWCFFWFGQIPVLRMTRVFPKIQQLCKVLLGSLSWVGPARQPSSKVRWRKLEGMSNHPKLYAKQFDGFWKKIQTEKLLSKQQSIFILMKYIQTKS